METAPCDIRRIKSERHIASVRTTVTDHHISKYLTDKRQAIVRQPQSRFNRKLKRKGTHQ